MIEIAKKDNRICAKLSAQFKSDIERFVSEISTDKTQFNTKSSWFQSKQMMAYIRVGGYFVRGIGISQCLVMANVEVFADYINKGLYSEFLTFLKNLSCKYQLGLVIENVLDKKQHSLYTRRGFEKIVASSGIAELLIEDYSCSFYLPESFV